MTSNFKATSNFNMTTGSYEFKMHIIHTFISFPLLPHNNNNNNSFEFIKLNNNNNSFKDNQNKHKPF